ncbi:uncharacterized protein LOC127078976 [Lathyrus oleraceus]|uniref:uncharacterized protein LOC127078976 n=1 Tax=Pisum sativum TaxID=3888 RepID=UPI0021D37C2C|nr:uncharacterized protein LOC127078976 [Pisum sativum]
MLELDDTHRVTKKLPISIDSAKIKGSRSKITSLKNGDNFITEPAELAALVVNYYSKIFGFVGVVQDNDFPYIINTLVNDSMNDILTSIPSKEEITATFCGLRKESAPGPDEFGGVSYQTYWNVIQDDVCNATWKFFKTGWMLPNFNVNIIVLIPKTSDVDSMDHYIPIAIANFKFKLISKIIADRLAKIMHFLAFKEHKGFIQGRNINDCLCLASEVANLLDKKTHGGNVALKIDITKAFHTIN